MVKKIIVDTSVLIAGILGNSTSRILLNLIFKGKVKILLSHDIFDEYIAASHYSKIVKRVDTGLLDYILDAIFKKAEILDVNIEVNLCRDPKDNKFFSLAIYGDAEAIVTWDSDILSLRNENKIFTYKHKKIYILTPPEFLGMISFSVS
ncbi:MAG: putative toxin-antitoxin system toxin component, PIN family [Candidatus Asgardarchaeum sp.]